MLVLPIIFSPSPGKISAPFATVAIAGHGTASGEWCSCGCERCICDPGEVPIACGNRATSVPDKGKVDSSVDLGSASLIALLILLVYFKLRG
jgi:hypothetical protein